MNEYRFSTPCHHEGTIKPVKSTSGVQAGKWSCKIIGPKVEAQGIKTKTIYTFPSINDAKAGIAKFLGIPFDTVMVKGGSKYLIASSPRQEKSPAHAAVIMRTPVTQKKNANNGCSFSFSTPCQHVGTIKPVKSTTGRHAGEWSCKIKGPKVDLPSGVKTKYAAPSVIDAKATIAKFLGIPGDSVSVETLDQSEAAAPAAFVRHKNESNVPLSTSPATAALFRQPSTNSAAVVSPGIVSPGNANEYHFSTPCQHVGTIKPVKSTSGMYAGKWMCKIKGPKVDSPSGVKTKYADPSIIDAKATIAKFLSISLDAVIVKAVG